MEKRIAIIGGGIAGLTCAYELQQAGFAVTVFESESTPGGRMRSREKNGLMFDIGATHLIPLYTHMKEYIEEFEIGWEQMLFEQYGLVVGDKVKPIDKGLGLRGNLQLAKLMKRVQREAAEKGRRNTYDLNEWVEEDTESAYTYMEREAGARVADYVADGFTAAYQFHLAKDASRGGLAAMVDSIVQNRDGWYLHHMTRGMSALPDALAERIDRVYLDTPVTGIRRTEDGEWIVTSSGRGAQTFDAVVCATPAFVTRQLLADRPGFEEHVNFLEQVRYAATISLAFRVKLDTLPEYSITWVPHTENNKFSGISNEQMKGEDLRNTSGDTLVCTWLHHDYAAQLLEADMSDAEIFTETRREFAAMCPWVKESDLEPHDLQRWNAAMPVFETGSLKRVKQFMDEHQGDNGLFLCGDYLNSPWTEGALQNGQRVAQAVQEVVTANTDDSPVE